MKLRPHDQVLFYGSVAAFALSSAAVFFLPREGSKTDAAALPYLIGALFWLFLALGILAQIILWRRRAPPRKKGAPWRVFRGPLGIAADSVFCLSLVGNLLFYLLRLDSLFFQKLMIFGLFFGFESHFVVNSGNYENIIAHQERRREK